MVQSVAAAVPAEAVLAAARLAGILEARRCQVNPRSAVRAECPKEYLASAHATAAVACFSPELAEVGLVNNACLAGLDE